MNVQVGSDSAKVMKELEAIEARQTAAKTIAVEPIHTVTPKKPRTKAPKK
jgi:hypothetical protein